MRQVRDYVSNEWLSRTPKWGPASRGYFLLSGRLGQTARRASAESGGRRPDEVLRHLSLARAP